MTTELEQRLRDALHDDAARARLVNPDRPTSPDARPLSVARPAARPPWRALAAAAAVVLIVAAGLTVIRNRDGSTGVTTSPGPTEVFPDLPPDATVTLPPGPISGLAGPGGVWTGTELVVWGERSMPDPSPPREGSAFNPKAGTWRVIAPAPIERGVFLAWTGTEMIVWGTQGGAAYAPATDTWRLLPQPPIAAREDAAAVWTGSEVIVLTDRQDDLEDPVEAAAYDPETDTWRLLAETNGELTPYVSRIVATESESQPVWTGTSVLTILDVSAPSDDGSARGLGRYDLSTDTWHIDTDAHYATLVGVPDTDGVTRTVLAMPVEPGKPVDLLDAAGTRIGSVPAHPVDLRGSITDATGLWLDKEAVFWIRGADWVLGGAEPWAVNPATGTWRPLPEDLTSRLSQAENAVVAVGDVLLASDGASGLAYRSPT